MRYTALFLILCIWLWSCGEDKKKTPDETSPTELNITSEKAPEETDEPVSTKKPADDFPQLTNENVVPFLTEYGAAHPETKAIITTQQGSITLELFEDTPLHRANFVYLVNRDYFDGTFFHRVVPNFIIQGGNSDNVSTSKKRASIGKDYLLPAEITGREHTYGTVSGAKEYRANPDNRSAPFEFFIFLGPPTSKTHLDGKYTVFARVTKGMDVVEKIANLPADEGEWPLQNVYITEVTLE